MFQNMATATTEGLYSSCPTLHTALSIVNPEGAVHRQSMQSGSSRRRPRSVVRSPENIASASPPEEKGLTPIETLFTKEFIKLH